jgi:hypothetical protein
LSVSLRRSHAVIAKRTRSRTSCFTR